MSSGQTLGVKAQRFRGHTSPHRNVKEKNNTKNVFRYLSHGKPHEPDGYLCHHRFRQTQHDWCGGRGKKKKKKRKIEVAPFRLVLATLTKNGV
eukprot:TRINITY_DN4041_c1_g1_i4.p3 TRINITY_DN4041_c1_g1~~TRINITY_DN4041_c1_g1_i4.p3  ORF type:complete len:104 (+),score=21.25 TRINITY_DN4041_c1_g1_i4:35-313(+)